MSPQVILRIAGIALLVIGALFAFLAIHYFVSNDIRGVMDDLSGKARAKGVAGARGRAMSQGMRSSQSRRRSDGRAQAPAVTKGTVSTAESAESLFEGHEAPQPAVALDEEDGMGTMVVDVDFGAMAAPAQTDTSGGIAEPGQDSPAGAVAFRVTRSIVLCDSNQIIAAD